MSSMASKWPPTFKKLNFEIMFLQGTLDNFFVGLKNVKNFQFWCHIVLKKWMAIKSIFLWHQAWPHNDLLILKTKVQVLHHTYLWPPLMCNDKAMDKEKIEAMATKFSEKFAIDMLKKHRKFCRLGFTHLDTTSIFQKSSRYLWDTL